MSEARHADLLAQWLTAAPGTEPPDGLEEEVLGAIYALAPDRAPAHRVRIDDVLSTLVSGPVADPEVAEAAIALNPDLAPDHSVGIDAILDSVTTGPFAMGDGSVVDLAAARRRTDHSAATGPVPWTHAWREEGSKRRCTPVSRTVCINPFTASHSTGGSSAESRLAAASTRAVSSATS